MKTSSAGLETSRHDLASFFDELRRVGLEALEQQRLDEALRLFEKGVAIAEEIGDEQRIDLARCNRAAVAIELRQGLQELPMLREILVRSADLANCRLAAYHIARHYELVKNFKKSLFYARIALDRSIHLRQSRWEASSRNLIGNALLAESQTAEARKHYEQALATTDPDSARQRAVILDNLGYCLVLQGEVGEGLERLHAALRLSRGGVAPATEILSRLDLCYAYIEIGRLRHAWRHGQRGLALAERKSDPDGVKNGLYLLGEVASLLGDEDGASACFTRLQSEFYPHAAYLPDFLMSIDVRKLINLHA